MNPSMAAEYRPKILVVDDSPENLKAVLLMLRKTEFILLQAESGEECMKITTSEKPDIIILDINLPDINGYEVCRQIKSNTDTEGIFILLSTAINITPSDQTKGFESGAEGFIIKPFTRNELLARLSPLVRLARAEKERIEFIARIKESESRYQALVENSPDLIAICRDNKILFMNPAGKSMLEIDNNNEAIQDFEITRFVDPNMANDFINTIRTTLQTNEKINYEAELVTSTGKPLPMEITFIPIKYEGNLAIQITGRDISVQIREHEKLEKYSKELEEKVKLRLAEVKEKSAKLEESQRALTYLLEDVNESRLELENANRNLLSLNRELEAFTYTVSHDLRAPIRAIDGFSRILVEEYFNQLDDEGKRLLGIIINSAAKMQQLIDDLLAFSRLGSKQPAKHQIDSNMLIAQIIDEVKAAYPGRNLLFQIGDLPGIFGDQGMIKQVFVNIIGNAAKFTAKREVAKIEIGGESENGVARIWVKDNGVGFDMIYAQKIFEVFQRLHDSKDFEGTGIGMAIVKKIIDKHNGKIIPESEPGKGSVFTVELPMA